MLPKRRRLTAKQVREVIKSGRTLREGAVSCKYLPAPEGAASMVASSKVAPKAVMRNALRRKGYQALPSPLPHYRMVFFIQRKDFDSTAIATLCSKLS